MTIYNGRYTAQATNGEEFVVFLIGMRINKWWAIHKWGPVFLAMGPMIRELYSNKGLGFMSLETFFAFRSVLMVQYWESEDALINYARGEKHLKAWRDFNQKASQTDAVGIYHETYPIKAGQFESIYGNMPKFGLAKALHHTTITPETKTARQRLGS